MNLVVNRVKFVHELCQSLFSLVVMPGQFLQLFPKSFLWFYVVFRLGEMGWHRVRHLMM